MVWAYAKIEEGRQVKKVYQHEMNGKAKNKIEENHQGDRKLQAQKLMEAGNQASDRKGGLMQLSHWIIGKVDYIY